MASTSFLSKSTFIRGIQCEKSLYLHKKRPFLRDRLSPDQLAKFSRGHKVGYLARGLFPGGVDVSPVSHFQMGASIKKTAAMINDGADIIYEASFEFQGVRVALDILYKDTNGQWHAVEVKSSAAISETFLWDASLQYYVITGSGLPLADFSIAYINAGYVRSGDVELMKLFIIESVLELVKGKQSETETHVERFRKISELKTSPGIDVGPHCYSPYPCDFIGHCWKHHPDSRHARPDTLHPSEIHWIKNALIPPVAILSLLNYAPAIPPYDGVHPYQKLPYSVALSGFGTQEDQVQVYTAEPGSPFSGKMIAEFLDATKPFNTLLVFDKDAEIDILSQLVADDKGLQRSLTSVTHKMISIGRQFSDPPSAMPGGKMYTNPIELISELGIDMPLAEGTLKTVLEASQAYAAFAESSISEEVGVDLADIEVFQRHCLAGMRSLAEYILKA
jgi:hypothetical protein